MSLTFPMAISSMTRILSKIIWYFKKKEVYLQKI